MKKKPLIEFRKLDEDDNYQFLPTYLENIDINTIQSYMVNQIGNNLNNQLEGGFIEGLKRKGFEFDNRYELESFVKEHCRCEYSPHLKEKVYYVDDIPFLLHKYVFEIRLDPVTENRITSVSASLGEFCYL